MRTRWEGNSGGGRGVMARQINWIEHFAVSHSSRDPVLSRIRTPDADASPTLNPTSRTADRNDTNIPPQIQPSFLTSGRHATGSGGGSGSVGDNGTPTSPASASSQRTLAGRDSIHMVSFGSFGLYSFTYPSSPWLPTPSPSPPCSMWTLSRVRCVTDIVSSPKGTCFWDETMSAGKKQAARARRQGRHAHMMATLVSMILARQSAAALVGKRGKRENIQPKVADAIPVKEVVLVKVLEREDQSEDADA